MSSPIKVKIEVFRAIDHLDKCQEYLKGHRKVLVHHGLTNITSNDNYWIEDPNVYFLLASDESNNSIIYGGVRIHIKTKNILIPIEKAIFKIRPNIESMLADKTKSPFAEICGLWNSKTVAGKNISLSLSTGAFALLTKLGVKSCYMFNARFTFRITKSLGFLRPDFSPYPNEYLYPNKNFKSYIWLNENISELQTLHDNEKNLVQKLRKNYLQPMTESCYSRDVYIRYNLF